RAFSASRDIDGRIAYLKAELKITPQQEPQFDRVAQAMRDNATAKDQAIEKLRADRGQPKNAVERLELRQQLAAERAQQSQRFLDAFKPLYASLSADQKKAADETLTRHNHHGHWRG
ncbi:MAG TPA: Spy/CpxP family protein refolding chaperone, partial [Stellaceae bacterium]|nr:Spy/CpxP family protein refolding chaperone [Stellaceae bacterium]